MSKAGQELEAAPPQENFYDLLEVTRDANAEDIKKAYRSFALKYHPDRDPSDYALNRFKTITKAYQTLKDAESRQAYDHRIFGTGEAGTSFRGNVPDMATYDFSQAQTASNSYNVARSTINSTQTRLDWEDQHRYRSAKWNRMSLHQKKVFRKAAIPKASGSVASVLLAVPLVAGLYYASQSVSEP